MSPSSKYNSSGVLGSNVYRALKTLTCPGLTGLGGGLDMALHGATRLSRGSPTRTRELGAKPALAAAAPDPRATRCGTRRAALLLCVSFQGARTPTPTRLGSPPLTTSPLLVVLSPCQLWGNQIASRRRDKVGSPLPGAGPEPSRVQDLCCQSCGLDCCSMSPTS